MLQSHSIIHPFLYTCEVSLCIVSWLSLNFCAENSSTRSSWALFISPIVHISDLSWDNLEKVPLGLGWEEVPYRVMIFFEQVRFCPSWHYGSFFFFAQTPFSSGFITGCIKDQVHATQREKKPKMKRKREEMPKDKIQTIEDEFTSNSIRNKEIKSLTRLSMHRMTTLRHAENQTIWFKPF